MTNRSEAASGPRVSPAYALIRVGLIHIMASKGVSTNDIAAKLGVNRSYVIRLRGLVMEPQTDEEQRIADLAPEHSTALMRLGMGFALKPGFHTVLAGGDRSERIEKGVGGGRPRGSRSTQPAAPPLSEQAQEALAKAQSKLAYTPRKKGRPPVHPLAVAPQETIKEPPVGPNHKRAAQARSAAKAEAKAAEAAAALDRQDALPADVPAPKKKLGGAERKRLKKLREQEQQAALNLGAPPAPDTIL